MMITEGKYCISGDISDKKTLAHFLTKFPNVSSSKNTTLLLSSYKELRWQIAKIPQAKYLDFTLSYLLDVQKYPLIQ